MKSPNKTIVLITGTSSGIGKATAELLVAKGYTVYGGSRQAQPADNGLIPLEMDVRDCSSVQRGLDRIVSEAGQLDVLINNAGVGYAGAIEDSSIEEVKAQFETNFFGTFRLCKEVLPVMRRQQGGTIINMSSIMGLVGLPFQALYSASKFAVEGLTEGLRLEVKDMGIHVTLVEPGDFRTRFMKNRVKIKRSVENVAYNNRFERILSIVEKKESNAPPPDLVAAKIYQIMRTRRPKPRYKIGNPLEKAAPFLKNVLPAQLYEQILTSYYR